MEPAAGMLHCPACGAPVEAGARHCSYCRAPVATVRCAACFDVSPPGAVHCAGCGRELGLEPIPEPAPFGCPACGRELTAFAGGPGRLYDCPACGGQFVEQALLRELLERREIYGSAVPRRPLAPRGELAPVRYLPCPACEALMNRTHFGGTSGVVVDVCARHGVWFDAGELPRVLAFVEGGGLARARQRELAELAERRRQLSVLAVERAASEARGSAAVQIDAGLGTGPLGHSSPPAWSGGLWEDARDAVVQALQLLGEDIARYRGR